MVSFPYYSHTIPTALGILDWEWYGNSMGKGSHDWGSLKFPLIVGLSPLCLALAMTWLRPFFYVRTPQFLFRKVESPQ